MSGRLHVGTRKGLLTYEEGPDGWRVVGRAHLGIPVTMVLQDPADRTLYAALDHGHYGVKFHRSSDEGETWEELGPPSYSPAGSEAEAGTEDESPSLRLIWSLETGGEDRPGTLWAGTLPGGLFLSRDRGETWELNRSLWDRPERKEWFGGGYDEPGIHSICVDPRDSDRVLVAVSCGGVWLTEDGGDTWETRCSGMKAEYVPPDRQEDPSVQDPHRLARCGADPDALWVQHHNGVYRSRDEGRAWTRVTEIPPSDFGFTVAVHPQDPDTAWLVPAIADNCRVPVERRVVVTRTRDGGKSFEVLDQGLPQQEAYDLVYRHCLEVSPDGDSLVLGTTSGSLWVSRDRGDSWQPLSHHLPPVFVTRFAP